MKTPHMFVCYSRYDKMSGQVLNKMRLGCKKGIIYRQDPVPQVHELTSFLNAADRGPVNGVMTSVMTLLPYSL